MNTDLVDRRILVTGATSGIGRACATAFAAEGARVAVGYRRSECDATALAQGLGAEQGRALAVRYALEDPSSPEEAVAAVEREWGGVDVLVANAVRRMPRRDTSSGAECVDRTTWEPYLVDNLAGTIATVLRVLPGMRAAGWGRVVAISSHVVRDGVRGQEFYAAAKAGLHGFCRSLARDAGGDGILVNVVCPGLTATDGVLRDLPAEVLEGQRSGTPTGRLGSPEDVTSAVVYLASAANGHLTGEVVTVAGGK